VAFVNQYIEFGMLDVLPLLGPVQHLRARRPAGDAARVAGAISAMQYVETLQTPEFIAFRDALRGTAGAACPRRSPSTPTPGSSWRCGPSRRSTTSTTAPALIDALRATDYPDAPRGGFYLDEFANPVHNIYIREVREVDGQLMNVGIVRVPEVSQFGPYDPEVYMAQPIDARDYPPDACAEMPAEMLDVEEVYEFIPMGPID
jgi:branched-chain amino acid transport system substrate-binding protein